MGLNILVTGGAGFIGSFTVEELLKRGHKVRILDNLDPQVHPAGELPGYISKEAEFIKGDVRNTRELEKAIEDIDVIFHLAAVVGVGQSMYEIKKYVDINIGATANLLDILVNKKNKVKKLIVAGSMSSYGEGSYVCGQCGAVSVRLRSIEQMQGNSWEVNCPFCKKIVKPAATKEEKKLECHSIYAITKKVQEEMVLNTGKSYSIPVVALRYFNVYGPRQSLSNPYTGVIAIFISRIKNKKRPVFYEDGLQTRDFVSVHDIVRANILAMESQEADYNVFNVGTGIPTAIKDVAATLIDLLDSDIAPEITLRFRKGDVRHCFADISAIKDVLKFKPEFALREGIKELISWCKNTSAQDYFEVASEELKNKGLLG